MMEKIYNNILTGLLCVLFTHVIQAQPSELVLNSSESGTKLHQTTNNITFASGYSYTPDGGTMTAEILESSVSGNIIYSPAIDPASYTINTSLALKSNPINISVAGTSICSVPIETPNGTKGLQPNLSLNYTGNFIPGIFGTGWDIGGLSMISRVNPNIYNDNQSNPIEGSLSDRYTLDGNRLIVVNGTYGTAGSEYRTEREVFSKIVANGTAGEGPLYFIVYTKSGLICEYGNSTDSRALLDGSNVLHWKVNKISDRYGNYITFKYVSSDEHPIEKIEYTGNTSQGTAPFASINFSYKNRSNISVYTIGEVKFYRDILLTEINITNNGQFFKKYELDYCENNSYPLLQKVTEYSSQNQPFNPQIFTYTKQTEQFSTVTNPYSASVKERIYQGDFNGDGRMDILTVPLLTDQSLNKKWKVYLAGSTGNFSFFWEGDIVADINSFIVADFNGDGLSDFAQIDFDVSVSDVYLYPSTGTGFGNPAGNYWSFSEVYPNVYVVDYNGDGRLEVMGYENKENARYELRTYSGEFIHEGWINGTGTLPPFVVDSGFFQIQDFNGDGCSDLLTLNDTGFKLHEFKGTNNTLTVTSTGDKLKNTYSLRYGDFNGDGTTDVLRMLVPENPSWSLVVYTRYGFKDQPITGLPNFNMNLINNQWHCCDLNGDAKMDVILWGKGTTGTRNKIYTAINKVNGYQYSLQEYTSPINFDMSAITPDNPLYFYFGDFNGDTREEFFYSKPGSQRQFSFASGTTSNLMKTAIDGLGTKTSLAYLPSSDWSVYKTGIRPDYPLSNYTKAIQLVSTVSRDNGIGGNTTVSYNYNGSKVHLQGKGFLGFYQTTEKNNATGIVTVKTVEIDGTYYYPQLSSVITMYDESNTVLTNAGGTWNELDFGNKRFFPYLASSVEIDELTKLLRFKSQDYFADGNLKSVTTNFSSGPTRTREFLYNDERVADWLIGRPTTITERSMGGSGTRTFVTNRSYFSANNSPDIDQYNTGDASAWTLDREYDAFGNLWKEHRSATGLSTRTTTNAYDSQGLNLISVTDPVGRINSYTYVPATGLVSTETDPFGNLTTYNYNSADQLSSVDPGVGPGTIYSQSLNVTGGPTHARYSVRETGSDHSEVLTWYDKLGREIWKETKSFSGTMVKVGKYYNTKGQLYWISEPTTGTIYNWNVIGYDNYGRVTSQDPYYGATTTYSYADSVITRTVNGRNYTSTINSAGLIAKRTDPGGSIRYAYYPDGLLKSTLTSQGVLTAMTYDRNGNRLSITDPSAGAITDTWYGTGEIKTHQNARGQTTIYTYQTDGLLDKYTTSAEGETDYTYNTKGQVTNTSSPVGVSRSYTYNTEGMVSSVTESIDGTGNSVTFEYDVFDRLYRKYFNGSTDYEQYDHNINGYLYRISFNGTSVWELTEMDEYGRNREATTGNSPGIPLLFFWEYENNNTLSLIDGLGTFEYSFNVNTGNLNSRTDALGNSESFGYDTFGLDRLTSVTGPSAMSVNYGSNGNILTKSDAGTGSYAYTNTPYAVSSITGAQNISTTLQDIDYYSFEKVKKITEGTKTADFVYNADQQRIRMILKDNGTTTKTRWYFGGSQEQEQVGSTTTRYIWIGGDAYTAVAAARKVGSGNWEVFNIFRDHSGTMTSLRNSTTDMIDDYSFDAWGRRRDKDNWTYNLSSEPALFAGRGFTAHEHLEDFNLINMNGRLYDPVVGRFLSPDPIVQAPDFTQGFNRYSYALNNPLKYTDPSGYTWWGHFWNWVGEGFDNLGDWMAKNNIQFQVGINMSGSGTVPFANVSTPNGVNASVGYNIENDMLGIGTNTNGFNSFWYPSYNYNATVENAYASMQKGMNEWYAKNDGDNSFMGGGWHPPMALYNIDKAVNWLDNNAHESWKDAKGRCAYYVRMALEAGGINTRNHPVPARLYGSYLKSWGFSIENSANYLKGDIAVIQGYPGATSDPKTGIPYGHIQMYNGSIWISDFKQFRDFWPGGGYRTNQPSFVIYRWDY